MKFISLFKISSKCFARNIRKINKSNNNVLDEIYVDTTTTLNISDNKNTEDVENNKLNLKDQLKLFELRNKNIIKNKSNTNDELHTKYNSNDYDKEIEQEFNELDSLNINNVVNKIGKIKYNKPINISENVYSKSNIVSESQNYLVNRPSKFYQWGEENNYSNKFKFNIDDEIKYFNYNKENKNESNVQELLYVKNLVKILVEYRFYDIKVFPTLSMGYSHLKENTILCTGYNNKHIYKFGKELVCKLKSTNETIYKNLTFNGRKYDEFMRIDLNEIDIFFMTESRREELSLEQKWLAPEKEYKELALNEIIAEKSKKRKNKY